MTIAVGLGLSIVWALRRERADWGVLLTTGLAIAIGALFINNYAVSTIFGIANCAQCGGGGNSWGAAQWDVNLAGWLYTVAAVLVVGLLVRFMMIAGWFEEPM